MDFRRPAVSVISVRLFTILAVVAFLMLARSAAFPQTVQFTGAQSTVRSFDSSTSISPIAVNSAGDIFAVETSSSGRSLIKIQANGTRIVLNSNFPFSPHTIAVNTTGNTLYFLYSGSTTCGTIAYEHLAKTTVTGNTAPAPTDLPCGFTFPQIPGWNASYVDPHDIKVDASGNLFIADYGGGTIWKIPPTSTVPTQYIPTAMQPYSIGLSSDGSSLYYTYMECPNWPTCQYLLGRIPTSTFTSTIANGAPSPTVITRNLTTMQSGLLIDPYNNIYAGGTITSGPYQGDSVIYKVLANGTLQTVTPPSPNSLYSFGIDGAGHLYTSGTDNSGNPVVSNTSFDAVNVGPRSVGSASPGYPLQFLFGTAGQLSALNVVTEGEGGRDFVNKGTGTCNTSTNFDANATCTVDVTFTPTSVGLRKGAVILKNSTGAVIAQVFLYGTGLGPQVAFDPAERNVVTASLQAPSGLAVDPSGNVYVSDSTANNIRKETLSGGSYTEMVFQTGLNRPAAILLDGAGNIYVANSGANSVVKNAPSSSGYTTTTPITGLNNPQGIAVDGAGNIYVANTGANQILKETLSGGGFTPSVIASGLNAPAGVAVDGSGTVYIADSGNDRILNLTVSGTSYSAPSVIVDGTSGLDNPTGIAVDGGGNIYIADKNNGRLLRSSPSGVVSVIANSASGIGTVSVVTVDGVGNVYVADTTNNKVVQIASAEPSSLTFETIGIGGKDGPKTAILTNVGNQALTFPASSTANPVIGAHFTFDLATNCAQLAPNATTNFVLNAGQSCQYAVNFVPTAYGTVNESLTMYAYPRYGSVSIPLVGSAQSPVTVWPAGLQSGTFGTAYSATLSATDGTAPYTFALVGQLPPGLTLSSSGVLSGTPSAAGTYDFEVSATDSTASTGSRNYSVTIAKATQDVVTASAPAGAYFAQTGLLATASGGSGTGAYSFSASGTACSVNSLTGALTITAGTGTCSITATRAADSNYGAANSAAASVAISKAAQTAKVTVTAPTSAYYAQTGLAANASGGNGSGAYTYSTTGSNACSINATSGALTITSGTGICAITATRAADSNYSSAASDPASITINKAAQAIVTVNAPLAAFYAQTSLTVTAYGGSGTGLYSYSSTGSTACSIDETTGALSITSGTGTCTITAKRASDDNYQEAQSAIANVTVNKASQIPVTLMVPPSAIYAQTGLKALGSGGSGTGSYSYSATGSSACSVDSSTGALTITSGTGTCSIIATRASDDNYTQLSSPAGAIVISKAEQAEVLLSAPLTGYYMQSGLMALASGGNGTGVYTYSATGSNACAVDSNTGALTITSGTGTCSIVATRATDNNYNAAASSSASVSITKADQAAVALNVASSAHYAQSGLSAVASGGSGTGAYTYGAIGSTACSIDASSGALTITSGTGTCSITATRASDDNYVLATSLPSTLTINKAAQAPVTINAPASAIYAQTGLAATASGGTGAGTYIYSATGSSACSIDAISGALTITSGTGSCLVSASRSEDDNYSPSAPSSAVTVSISKAAQSAVTVTAPTTAVYAQSGLIATASGGNGTGEYSYSAAGSTACSVDSSSGTLTITAGTGLCSITARRAADSNYLQAPASAQVSVVVKKAPASVTPRDFSKTYDKDQSTDPTLTGTLIGFAPTDGISATYSRVPGQTVLGGPYTITATLSPSSALGNYEITYNTGKLEITPHQLTVAANNAETTYNSAIPTLDGSLTGGVDGDTISATYSTAATVGSDAGQYPINPTLHAGQETLANYSITSTDGALTIHPAPNTQVTLSTSASSKYYGESVTLTAKVTSTAGVPSGNVSFMEGESVVAVVALNGGKAVFSSSTLSIATHTFTAKYTGNVNFVGADSNAIDQTIVSPVISINGSSTGTIDSITLQQGGSASKQFTLGSLGTLSSAVALTCSGLPSGLDCALSQSSVGANSLPATITVNVTSTKLRIVGRNANKLASLGYALGLVLPGLVVASRKRKLFGAIAIMLCIVMIVAMSACGSGSASTGITNGGQLTAPGTYTGTITASSTGTATVTAKFTVVLQ